MCAIKMYCKSNHAHGIAMNRDIL